MGNSDTNVIVNQQNLTPQHNLTPQQNLTPQSNEPKHDTKSPSVDLVTGTTDDLCPTLLIKRGKRLMLFNKNMPEIPKENPLFFDNLEQYIEYVKVQREIYGQNCPVLFLQEETNAQGEDVYRMRQPNNNDVVVDPLLMGSVSDYFQNKTNVMPAFKPQSGPKAFNHPTQNNSVNLALYNNPNTTVRPPNIETVPYIDSNLVNKPYNQGIYGFDPTSQYVGKYTVLDQIHDSTQIQNKDGASDNAMDTNWGGAVFTINQIKAGKYDGNEIQTIQ